ncbi:MAG TPA: OmpA family protein [Steroidobacter sp.]|nr:OmpA family protein [Steroidobacter sp.]
MRFFQRCAAAALFTFLLANAAQSSSDLELAGLKAAIERARQEQLNALAPTNFAAALRAYETALKDQERRRDGERIRARIQEGENALRAAERNAMSARESLSGTLKAREDALAADAPGHAPEAWSKANERFLQAMASNEAGDLGNAQRRAAEAQVLLRDVELTAIKNGILGEARTLIAQADEAKVERFAPRSLQASKRRLADAEQEIQRNRYDLALPRRLAADARYEAHHALYLARLIERTLQEKDDRAGVEVLILSVEEPLQRMASGMEISVQFDRGFQEPLKELGEHAQQQAQELRRLKLELEEREDRVAALEAQAQRLEARLGGVSEERIALQRRLDAQDRLRANVAAISGSFTPDEARVERHGDDVVVSLLGVGFPSGRSTIGPESAALMQKVQKALALFPDAVIAVEGHTDANGGESANLILSQDRADAVRQYLGTQFGLDPEKISSIGYGEARPVATNETAAGRARNRRIDLIIHPEGRN